MEEGTPGGGTPTPNPGTIGEEPDPKEVEAERGGKPGGGGKAEEGGASGGKAGDSE